MGTDCSRGSKQPLQRPRSEGIFSTFKDGKARELEMAEDEKKAKKSSWKGKDDGLLVKQGPGCHAGKVGRTLSLVPSTSHVDLSLGKGTSGIQQR